MNPTLFLRRVLAFDALTCLAMGGLLLVAAAPLAGLLAIPRAVLFEAGVILIPFALFVLWAMRRAGDSTAPARAVAAINLAWVAASFALFAFVMPNLLGGLFVTAQALAVAGIAALQFHALARTRALA
jgi:hypothetical protein